MEKEQQDKLLKTKDRRGVTEEAMPIPAINAKNHGRKLRCDQKVVVQSTERPTVTVRVLGYCWDRPTILYHCETFMPPILSMYFVL